MTIFIFGTHTSVNAGKVGHFLIICHWYI